jgi:pilus assembly protein CpaB
VGTLSLVLRNQVDPRPGTTEGATKGTLLGAHEAPPRPPCALRAAASRPRHRGRACRPQPPRRVRASASSPACSARKNACERAMDLRHHALCAAAALT